MYLTFGILFLVSCIYLWAAEFMCQCARIGFYVTDVVIHFIKLKEIIGWVLAIESIRMLDRILTFPLWGDEGGVY